MPDSDRERDRRDRDRDRDRRRRDDRDRDRDRDREPNRERTPQQSHRGGGKEWEQNWQKGGRGRGGGQWQPVRGGNWEKGGKGRGHGSKWHPQKPSRAWENDSYKWKDAASAAPSNVDPWSEAATKMTFSKPSMTPTRSPPTKKSKQADDPKNVDELVKEGIADSGDEEPNELLKSKVPQPRYKQELIRQNLVESLKNTFPDYRKYMARIRDLIQADESEITRERIKEMAAEYGAPDEAFGSTHPYRDVCCFVLMKYAQKDIEKITTQFYKAEGPFTMCIERDLPPEDTDVTFGFEEVSASEPDKDKDKAMEEKQEDDKQSNASSSRPQNLNTRLDAADTPGGYKPQCNAVPTFVEEWWQKEEAEINPLEKVSKKIAGLRNAPASQSEELENHKTQVLDILSSMDEEMQKQKRLQQKTTKQILFTLSQTLTIDRRDSATKVNAFGFTRYNINPKAKNVINVVENQCWHRELQIQTDMAKLGFSKRWVPQDSKSYSSVISFPKMSNFTCFEVGQPWIRKRICKRSKEVETPENYFKEIEYTHEAFGIAAKDQRSDAGKIVYKPQICLYDRLRSMPLKIAMHVLEHNIEGVPDFRAIWRDDVVADKGTGDVIIQCIFDVGAATCQVILHNNIELNPFRAAFIETMHSVDLARASMRRPYNKMYSDVAKDALSAGKAGAFPWTVEFKCLPADGHFDQVLYSYGRRFMQDLSDED